MGLFSPDIISKIQRYHVRARRVVEGSMIGSHKSPFTGTGQEFKQHREYVQGDDTRRLDWKIFAKTDRYFIKQFESETNMTCQVVVDCSESMNFKSDAPLTKYEYAATAAASLAYLLLLQRDSVGFTLFDDKVLHHLPPKATYSQFHHAVEIMEKVKPSAKTMAGNALASVAGNLKRRGMLIIFSDFIDDIEPMTLGLNRLAFEGHEVIAINVTDPAEKMFPFSGPAILEGLEQAGNLRCDPSDFREMYLEGRAAHYEKLRAVCRRLSFDLNELVTSTPVDEALSELLLQRQLTATR